MRKCTGFAVILLVCFSCGCWAQSTPYAHIEAYGGFSTISLGGGSNRTQLYGWQAGMTTYFTRSFGVVTDFAGQYKDAINIRQSLFGPQFSKRFGAETLFVHPLIGTSRQAGSNSLTTAVGGGLDFEISSRFSIRAAQVDWLQTHSGDTWFKDTFRFGSALLISFGRR